MVRAEQIVKAIRRIQSPIMTQSLPHVERRRVGERPESATVMICPAPVSP